MGTDNVLRASQTARVGLTRALVLVATVAAGCGGSAPVSDAGMDAGGDAGTRDLGGDGTVMCASDTQCDDGLFCTGTERCAPFTMGVDARGCARGTPPCTAAMCSESSRTCSGGCPDNDGDGHHDMACGGDDCDDTDPNRYPGNAEVCDMHDEDCDPATLGPDRDGDGYVAQLCCNGTTCGLDCDDSRSTVHPTAVESCNGVDDDCNGMIDDGVLLTFYRDVDGDGYGQNSMTMTGCSLLAGYSFSGNDCDDSMSPTARAVHPGAMEICDMIDNDCDGTTDPGCACLDGTIAACGDPAPGGGFLSTGICVVGTSTCAGGVLGGCIGAVYHTTEVCDALGQDEDCDGLVNEGVDVACYTDGDNDNYPADGAVVQSLCPVSDPARVAYGNCPIGYTSRAPTGILAIDCADSLVGVHPGATETCNGIDDDCNGTIDDGSGAPRTCYTDNDDDGYAPLGATVTMMCICPAHTTTRAPTAMAADCNDAVMTINPSVSEFCDALMVDENCNGTANEGCGCTPGMTQPCPLLGACSAGTQTCITMGATASFGACSILPAAMESCNAIDDNCDGRTDETFACIQGMTNPCVKMCGAATVPGGTTTCSSSCTLGMCMAPEICNGCDDDADGSVDDGFFCPQNAMQPGTCTTACGTSGTISCNGTCTAYLPCRAAAESCNYCDDNGDGTFEDDRPLTSLHSYVGSGSCFSGSTLLYSGGASCTGNVFGDTGQIKTNGTVTVGWGQVTARAVVHLAATGSPDGEITISLVTGVGVGARSLTMRWNVLDPEVVTLERRQLAATTVIGTDTTRAWDTFGAGETQDTVLQVWYTPSAPGIAESIRGCINFFCTPVYPLSVGFFGLGTPVSTAVQNNGFGGYTMSLQAGSVMGVDAVNSCR